MFKWKESFSCNIAEIDKQHKMLFEIGARIYDVASTKEEFDKYDDIMNILDELKQYTVYHFQYEEEIMRQYHYKDYEKHKIEHDFFIKKIQKIERKDIEAMQSDAVLEIVTFVADWVTSHILRTDIEYKGFLNSKGVY